MPLKKSDLDEIKKFITEQIKNILNDEFMKDLDDRVTKMLEEKYNKEFKNLEECTESLKSEVMALKEEKIALEKTMDHQEQFSRSLNIRIFGVVQENNEDIRKVVLNLFEEKMKLNCIVDSDINNCYRVSAKTTNIQDKPRPPVILVSFFNVNKRMAVLKQKKVLKSTGIQIQEDLTKTRLNIFNCAIKKFTVKNVWCLHGNIYVKCRGEVHRVSDENDLKNIYN